MKEGTKMNKKIYEAPELSALPVLAEDVISTSPGGFPGDIEEF